MNPFDEISAKLDALLEAVNRLEKHQQPESEYIPLQVFCSEYGITKVTAYSWRKKGMIEITRIDPKIKLAYVKRSSIRMHKKYERTQQALN